jgi:hypothetical protein
VFLDVGVVARLTIGGHRPRGPVVSTSSPVRVRPRGTDAPGRLPPLPSIAVRSAPCGYVTDGALGGGRCDMVPGPKQRLGRAQSLSVRAPPKAAFL